MTMSITCIKLVQSSLCIELTLIADAAKKKVKKTTKRLACTRLFIVRRLNVKIKNLRPRSSAGYEKNELCKLTFGTR